MAYPKTGQEVYVSLNLSNTMLHRHRKGTITREVSPRTISSACSPSMA